MKKRFILSSFAFAAMAILLMSNSGGRATSGNGDNTGAPTSNAFCQQCHSSGAFSPSLAIAVFETGTTTAVTEYIGGVTYDVKVTVTAANGSPAGYGMQMTCLDANNNAIVGFSEPSSNAQLATLNNGRQYVEQSGMSSTNVFTTKWTAPATNTGTVTFYAGGVAANASGSTAGDGATKGSLILAETSSSATKNTATLAVQIKAYPNPVTDVLNIETIGSTSGKHTLTIANMAGQIVLQQVIQLDFGMDFTQIAVENLAKGVYTLTLAQEGKVTTTQILKK